MKTSEAFPSNYLKAADLQGRQVRVTIDRVIMEDVGDESKMALYFVGKDKGMICNRTNAGSIEALYSDETDEWIGKDIILYSTKVSYQGSMVPAIRIMPPPQPSTLSPEQVQRLQQAREQLQHPAPPAPSQMLNGKPTDDIPF
jgi:hypothetical protein